jgi:hypothetical protein
MSTFSGSVVNGKARMLPDLPSLKREIQKILDRHLNKQIQNQLGFISESPKHIIQEGNRTRIIRANGSIQESELKQASTEMVLNMDDFALLTPEKRLSMINDTADKMAKKMASVLWGSLTDDLDKAGQVVDQQGKPLDPEAIFSMFEKIQLEFDETGRHTSSLVLSPELFPKAAKVMEQIQAEPSLRKRYEEIITRKRMQWRDREAARKLVG